MDRLSKNMKLEDRCKRPRVETELLKERERLHQVLENAPYGLMLVEKDGTVSFLNRELTKITGYTWTDFSSLNDWCQLAYPDLCYREEIISKWKCLCNYGINTPILAKVLCKDGEVKDIEFKTSRLKNEDSIIALLDVTEKKRLEEEVNRLDRLYLVGEMAASIAHEIRNPLTAVSGFLQMFSQMEEFGEHRKILNLMTKELDRANSIITEYLCLAKNKEVDLQKGNINNLIQNLFPLLLANAVMGDKIVSLYLNDIPEILMDQDEIRQLIINLTRNALEASPPGKSVNIYTFIDGGEVVLAVRDQGPGIEAHVLEKIMTPFFTTKEQGTGLGLPICYGIAKRHNAVIDIKTGSEGSTFFIRFPIKSSIIVEK